MDLQILDTPGTGAPLAEVLKREVARLREQAVRGARVVLCRCRRRSSKVEGVRFGQLWAALAPGSGTGDDTLAQVLQAARDLPDDQAYELQAHLDRWEPRIAAITAAAHGDTDAAAAVDADLAQLADHPDWAALAGVLRRILTGDRGQNPLAGLEPIGTAIAAQVLDRLANQPPATNPEQA